MTPQRKRPTGARVVTKAVTIRRPLWDVYRAWRRIQSFPPATAHLTRVREDGTRSHWIVSAPGGATEWDAEIIADVPGERIVWSARADAPLQHEGEVTFNREFDGKATELRVVLRWTQPRSQDDAAAAHRTGEHPKRRLAKELLRFKQMMESEVIDVDVGAHPRDAPHQTDTDWDADEPLRGVGVRHEGAGS